jgi:hypothetical protein
MQNLSSLLGKSLKQSVFQQAYIFSKIKTGLAIIQSKQYPTLSEEFETLDVFITGTIEFTVTLKTHNLSFKTFLKTEIMNIKSGLIIYMVDSGIESIKLELKLK